MRVIGDDERRGRLALRHRLTPDLRTNDVAAITDDLVVVHSSDPATVYMTIGARMVDGATEPIRTSLYDERSIVRHHGMRRTMWGATPGVLRLVHGAATAAIAAKERKKMIGWIDQVPGVSDAEEWLDAAMAEVADLIGGAGEMTARELGQRRPDLAQSIELAVGTKNQFTLTMVVVLLGVSGLPAAEEEQRDGDWLVRRDERNLANVPGMAESAATRIRRSRSSCASPPNSARCSATADSISALPGRDPRAATPKRSAAFCFATR